MPKSKLKAEIESILIKELTKWNKIKITLIIYVSDEYELLPLSIKYYIHLYNHQFSQQVSKLIL